MPENHKKSDKKILDEATTFGAAAFAGATGQHYSNATKEAFDGMELLRQKAEQILNVGAGQKQGNLFEIIEATKFNKEAALHSSDIRAFVTDMEGRPHAAADIEIRLGDRLLEEAQLKSYRSANESLFAQSQEKYADMQRISPSDQYDRMKELAEDRIRSGTLKADDYENTLGNLEKGLSYKNIHSPGTTRADVEQAALDHENFINGFKIEAVLEEASNNITNATMVGGAILGAVSIAKNAIAVKSGEIELDVALANITKETGNGALHSSVVAGSAMILKDIALDQGLGILAKSNVATATAVAVYNVSKSIFRYAKGEIGIEEMTIEMGKSGAQSVSGLYFGIAGGVVGGPVGLLIGSMAGYMLANISYQTVADTYKNALLTEEQYERLRPIYEESIATMQEMEQEFNKIMERYFQKRDRYISECFSFLDEAAQREDIDAMALGLVNLVSVFGQNLQLMSYSDFKEFMNDDSGMLRL